MCVHNGLPHNCVDCQEQKELKEREEALARGEEFAQSEYGPERYAAETAGNIALGVVGAIVVGLFEG